jgi:serine/threonine-protein kinase
MDMAGTAESLPRRGFPERIGRYRILDRIGRGAMGVVYRALDELMGREVALKVLMTDLEDEPDIRTRFQREAEAAARLSHPNIITIYDVGEDGDRLFIVMELLRGLTFREYLKSDDASSLDRKIDLMVQLCAGIGAAHNAAIYHRDIKPGNIFVRSDGIVKILDFGVARLATSNMTRSGFIVGTPDYMSPEQARGGDIDATADIFSLGGVFYFILTGRKPFAATDLPTLFHQIQQEDPAPLLEADAPAQLRSVIMKALSKKPERRYQSCQELMADLTVVRRLYTRGDRSAAPTVGAKGDAANHAGLVSPATPVAADVQPTSEDTVDSLPVTAFKSDETVVLEPPTTWLKRVTQRLDSTISSVFSRFWPSAPSASTNQPGMHKR